MNGYLWSLDVAVPYTALRLKGFKFEWLASGDLSFPKPEEGGLERDVYRYDGHAFFITPYWNFKLDYVVLKFATE
jgi:hypothetical protein